MRVRVLLFAGLKERLGTGAIDVDVEPGATVEQVIGVVGRRHAGLAESRFATALNQRYVERAAPVGDGDELALIPPVSGG